MIEHELRSILEILSLLVFVAPDLNFSAHAQDLKY